MNKKTTLLTDLETIQEWLRIYLFSNNKKEIDQAECSLKHLHNIFGFEIYNHLKKYHNKQL